jgi:hypothetical protein
MSSNSRHPAEADVLVTHGRVLVAYLRVTGSPVSMPKFGFADNAYYVT